MLFVKIIVIIAALSTISFASIQEIADREILGCYATSDSIIEFEKIVQDKIRFGIDNYPCFDFIKKGELSKAVISSRYLFEDVPNLIMYHTFTWIIQGGTEINPFTGVLFNSYDSTICFFDGDTNKFFGVVREYIKEISNCEQVISLIDLYFNTFSASDPLYLIKTAEDFKAICSEYGGLLKSEKQITKDIEKVNNIIKPISCARENNIFIVDCFMWDYRSSRLF